MLQREAPRPWTKVGVNLGGAKSADFTVIGFKLTAGSKMQLVH